VLSTVILPVAGRAHGTSAGTDIGIALLVVEVTARTVRVELTVIPMTTCDDFEGQRITAEQGTTDAATALTSPAACQFSGALDLPADGNWFVAMWLSFAGQDTQVSFPITAGVSRSTSQFSAPLHVPRGASTGRWSVRRVAVLVGLGAVPGLLLIMAYRWMRNRHRGSRSRVRRIPPSARRRAQPEMPPGQEPPAV
jgi:hypothetical protein